MLAILIIVLLIATYRKFKFSSFVYISVLVYSIVVLIDAKLNLTEHFYSNINHFIQGFVLLILVKEFTLRKGYLGRSDISYYIMISIAAVISQGYETIKFIISHIFNVSPNQIVSYKQFESVIVWNLFLSLVGAIIAVTVFGKAHDMSIEEKE